MGRRFNALTLSGALVAGGCSGNGNHETAPQGRASASAAASAAACSTLVNLNIIGASKDGGVNMVNTGECVFVYDPSTFKTVGNIAAGSAFVAECVDGPKPASLRVEAPGVTGDVELEGQAMDMLLNGSFKDLPGCPLPSASPTPTYAG